MSYVVKHDGLGRDVAATSAGAAHAIAERLVAEGKPNVRVVKADGHEWTAQEFKSIADALRSGDS